MSRSPVALRLALPLLGRLLVQTRFVVSTEMSDTSTSLTSSSLPVPATDVAADHAGDVDALFLARRLIRALHTLVVSPFAAGAITSAGSFGLATLLD